MKETHFFSGKVNKNFNPLIANNKTLFDMSLKFANGDGVELDFVAAHVCLNIAALRGCKESAEYRKELAYDMTSEQISQAQREARSLMKRIQDQSKH
jgi:uncharacterized protein